MNDHLLAVIKSALVLRVPLVPTARLSDAVRHSLSEPVDWPAVVVRRSSTSTKRRKGRMDLEGFGR